MFKKSTLRPTPTKHPRGVNGSQGLPSRLPPLGNIYLVGEKCRLKIDPTEADAMGRTALHLSLLHTPCDEDLVTALLRAGCDVSAPDKQGRRPLHYAARLGQAGCARWLLACGAVVDEAGKWGMTPLMEAAKHGQLSTLKVLLGAEKQRSVPHRLRSFLLPLRGDPGDLISPRGPGGGPDALDFLGRTALHHAASCDHAACVRALIDAGAALDGQDKSGDTPFVAAIRANAVAALEVLVDAGCDRTTIDEMMGTAVALASVMGHGGTISTLTRAGEDPDEPGYFGMTPLMLAVYESHLDTIDALLRNGADPNAKGRTGGSALRTALIRINSRNEAQRHKIIARLIRAGAKINVRINGKGLFVGCTNGNNSPLSFAISAGYLSAVRMLLAAGCDVPLAAIMAWIKSTNLVQFYNVAPLILILTEWAAQPRSLKHICRGAIRACIPGKVPEAVAELPIAPPLRRYVNYEEFDWMEVEKAEVMDGESLWMMMSDADDTNPCGLRMIEGSIMHLINKRCDTGMDDK